MSVWLQLIGKVNASNGSTESDVQAGRDGIADIDDGTDEGDSEEGVKNWWALLAIVLVLATAAGNILVCLAISRERRLQNVTNYFLMSLAITDLMVAVLVMPAGILTLITGFFPLSSAYCLAWICLDVLFCTASIMHLCTISVDRYLSLRYPMRFGRNKTRRRVTLKIVFVWLLSLAMSLPLSLMYSQDHASVLVGGTCQIPDPLYKLVGSIVCFYIPLAVMLLTYALTVRLLALQQTQLGGGGGGPGAAIAPSHTSTGSSASAAAWAGSGWLLHSTGLERRSTWGRFLASGLRSAAGHTVTSTANAGAEADEESGRSLAVPYIAPGPHTAIGVVAPGNTASSTETDEVTEDDGASSLEARDLWLTDEPTPAAVSALSHFGAEMLKLSRGLETVAAVAAAAAESGGDSRERRGESDVSSRTARSGSANGSRTVSPESLVASGGAPSPPYSARLNPASSLPFDNGFVVRRTPRRASTFHVRLPSTSPKGSVPWRFTRRRRGTSFHEVPLRWSGPSENTMAAKRHTADATNTEVTVDFSPALPESLSPREAAGRRSAVSSDEHSGTTTPSSPLTPRRSVASFPLPPRCTCPYFGQQAVPPQHMYVTQPNGQQHGTPPPSPQHATRVRHPQPSRSTHARHSSDIVFESSTEASQRTNNVIVTWDKGDSSARSTLMTSAGTSLAPPTRSTPALRRSATQRHHNGKPAAAGNGGGKLGLDLPSRIGGAAVDTGSVQSSPCLLVRYGSRSRSGRSTGTVRSHHSRTSSVASRTSSRHGRIIRLEQKATKVLGVVFFTFVVLWAPFFVLNLVPTVCGEECERRIDHRVFDFVTWLGYASSMVNPIFYTIFNKVFRQAFKKVLTCQYRKKVWRPPA